MTTDELAPGYDLPPAWAGRLAALDWIYDSGGSVPGAVVALASLLDRPAAEAQALATQLKDFDARGWIGLQTGWFQYQDWTCAVTPSGVDFIEAIRHRRGDTVARRRVARDAVLRWLFDSKVGGTAHPVMSDFATSPYGLYYGHAFNERETTDAMNWLKEQGYARGSGSAQGPTPRPTITAKGEQLVEAGRSVNDDTAPNAAADAPSSTVINVTGSNNNIAAFSPGATQAVSVTEDARRQVVAVADALEGVLSLLGLDSGSADEAAAVVSDLRTESAESSPDPGRLRQLLSRAQEVAVAGTGTAVGSAVVALAEQALKALGAA